MAISDIDGFGDIKGNTINCALTPFADHLVVEVPECAYPTHRVSEHSSLEEVIVGLWLEFTLVALCLSLLKASRSPRLSCSSRAPVRPLR